MEEIKEEQLHKYTKEELLGMQKINLQMAKVFFAFCKENKLTAYFCGGGCIGAIRNKGFIPWDDDLDFFMPRDDYESFIKLWPSYDKGKDFELSVQSKDYCDKNIFATLRNKNTTYVKPYQANLDIVQGVQLDIIPLDGYPDSKISRKFQVFHALIYSLFCSTTAPKKHGKLLYIGSKLMLSIFRGKNIRYKIWSRAKKKMTKYKIEDCKGITELCSGPGYMRNWYDKKWFESYIEVPFEDTVMPIPVGYDGYLKTAFGDYMELPPEEKRVAGHDCAYLDLKLPSEKRKEKPELDLLALQKKCLEITLFFKDFCDRNNLQFFLCGGGCIGAIRHKGFVPWDDDIDVFMPRDDYERLAVLWKEQVDERKYKLSKSSLESFERSQLTAITDEETTFVKERQMDLQVSHGVRLEVLPLDGCPASKFKRKCQLFYGLLYQIFINQEPPTSKGKLLELAGKIMLLLRPGWKRRYKMAMRCEKHMKKYPISTCDKITELHVRYNYMVNEYPKEIFESSIDADFEGYKLPIPVGYDKYLRMAFGDYMELPPSEDRVPSHDAVVIDLDNSYKKYVGVFYPKKREK